MNANREEALFQLALEKSAVRSSSDRFQMSLDPRVKCREDLGDVFDSFPHSIPLDLRTVAVVDDVPETAEGTELPGQRLVEQRGQRRLSGRAEAFEQVQVPVLARGQFDAMKAAQAFEDVFDARVELGEERGGGVFTDGWLASGHVAPEGFEFVRRMAQRLELDGKFLFQFLRRHRSTRARFSMSRVKGVGGSRGAKSSGTPRVPSSADANSKSFQPGTPAQARSRSRGRRMFQRAAKEQQPPGPELPGHEDGLRQQLLQIAHDWEAIRTVQSRQWQVFMPRRFQS